MTAVVAGPYALACALLVVAGVSKLLGALTPIYRAERAQKPAARRERAQSALAVVEIGLGGAAFCHQSALAAAAVAALYAGFVVVAWRAKAKQRACGCFGADERLPSTGHVVLNAALALSALAALGAPTSPVAYLGFTYAVLLGTATYLGVAVMTA